MLPWCHPCVTKNGAWMQRSGLIHIISLVYFLSQKIAALLSSGSCFWVGQPMRIEDSLLSDRFCCIPGGVAVVLVGGPNVAAAQESQQNRYITALFSIFTPAWFFKGFDWLTISRKSFVTVYVQSRAEVCKSSVSVSNVANNSPCRLN